MARSVLRSIVILAARKIHPFVLPATTQSFDMFFEEHWDKVQGVIFRMVGDPAQAEDLALEAFWRLYGRFTKTGAHSPRQNNDNLVGWLYRVATNLGYNALRARKRRARYELEAGMQNLETNPPPDPAVAHEKAQERRLVRLVLSRMKPRSARLLVLRHTGFSYREIAGILQLSTGSIGTLLVRAEREFEAHYRKLGGDFGVNIPGKE